MPTAAHHLVHPSQTSSAPVLWRRQSHTSAVQLAHYSKDAVNKAFNNVGGFLCAFWAISLPFEIYPPAVVVVQQAVCLQSEQVHNHGIAYTLSPECTTESSYGLQALHYIAKSLCMRIDLQPNSAARSLSHALQSRPSINHRHSKVACAYGRESSQWICSRAHETHLQEQIAESGHCRQDHAMQLEDHTSCTLASAGPALDLHGGYDSLGSSIQVQDVRTESDRMLVSGLSLEGCTCSYTKPHSGPTLPEHCVLEHARPGLSQAPVTSRKLKLSSSRPLAIESGQKACEWCLQEGHTIHLR